MERSAGPLRGRGISAGASGSGGRMRGARSAAPVIAGILLAGGAAAAPTPELSIGSAAEIDTQALRRAIEDTRGDLGSGASPQVSGASPDGPVRLVALEESIRLALEHNLKLQISALDRDVAEREVPARRAFFHPTPGARMLVSRARSHDPLSVEDDGAIVQETGSFTNRQEVAQVTVSQQLPTGALLTVGMDGVRDSGDQFNGNDLIQSGAQIELRQPLLRGGRIYVATAPIHDAEYTLGIFESRLRAQVLLVTADAKQAYYNTILAERLIQVSEQAIGRDHRLIEASEALYRAGRASQRDIVSAQIQLSDDLSDLAQRRASLDVAQLALRDVLGLAIGEYLKPADSSIPFEPVKIRVGTWIENALEIGRASCRERV